MRFKSLGDLNTDLRSNRVPLWTVQPTTSSYLQRADWNAWLIINTGPTRAAADWLRHGGSRCECVRYTLALLKHLSDEYTVGSKDPAS